MMSKSKKKSAKSRVQVQRTPKPVSRGTRGAIVMVTAFMLGCLILGGAPSSTAGTLAVPPSNDTVYMTSGAASFVLSPGMSMVSMINPENSTISGVFMLPVGANVAQDIDWNDQLQQVVVGCNNGMIFTVDPNTATVTMVANNPAANYSVITADNRMMGVVAYAFDSNAGSLDQILSTSLIVPVAPIPMTTVTELVEKTVDPTAPTAADDYIVAVGTNGGFTTIDVFDRATMLSGAFLSWTTAVSSGVGIDTTADGMAYVVANNPGGTQGYLLQFDLITSAWTPSPLKIYATSPINDVSASGQWVSVLLINPGGAGSWVDIFDVADATNVLEAGGVLINPGMNPGGGLDTRLGDAGTIDDLGWVHVGATTGASTEELINVRSSFVDSAPGIVISGTLPILTVANGVHVGQEAPICSSGCDVERERTAQDCTASGAGAATGGSVQFSTGEEVYTLPVLSVPGVGQHVRLALTYRSRQSFDYRYGQGWSLTADKRIKVEPNGDRTLYNGYGRKDTFVSAGGGTFLPPAHYDSILSVAGSTTITTRHGDVSTYDGTGRRISKADRYGNTITYSYTGDQLTSITDSLARVYTLNYNAQGRLSSIVDFGGRTWTFTYDYMGQLRSMTTPSTAAFPSGRTRYFSYTGNSVQARLKSNLVHVWSPKGDLVQSLEYDHNDMVTEEVLGPGTYEFSYNSTMRETTVVDRSGNSKVFVFNSSALPLTVKTYTKGLRTGEPAYFESEYRYDTAGNLVTQVLPRGNRIDYTYDSSLNLVELRRKTSDTASTSASDLVTTKAYVGPYSQLSSVTDPRGNTTNFTVDGSGNTTQITHPTVTSPSTQSVSEVMTYDVRGRLLSVTDGELRKVEFSYYAAGTQKGYLEKVVRDPAGLALTTTFTYDQYGNITSVTDPNGHKTTLTVDAENFVTEIEAPSPLNYRRRISYDANRNVTVSELENVDKDGVQDATTPWIATTMTYNVVDWMLTKSHPLTSSTSATTSYEYDGSGNLTKVVDAESNATTYDWDERHLLFKATRGHGTAVASETRYDYGLNGNLVKFTDGEGNATTRTYDLFDRIEKVTDALGHYREFLHDDNGNMISVTAYDVSSALVAKRTSHFDELNRPWKVVQDRFGTGISSSSPATTITRDRSHRVTKVTDPLGNDTDWTYDAAGRRKTAVDAVGNSISYTLDANGNVTKKEETDVPSSGAAETYEVEFVYDALNRAVSQKEVDRLDATNVLVTTNHYDSRSNLVFRVDAEGHPHRWTYDLSNRMTKFERALQLGASVEDFTQRIEETFKYDKINRLTEMEDDNFNVTKHEYDSLSRRTKTTYADTKSTHWTYDKNGNVASFTDQNGSVLTNTFDDLNRLTGRSVVKAVGVLGTTSESLTYDALGRVLTAVDNDYQVEFVWDSVGNLLQEKQGYNSGSPQWKTVSTGYTDSGSINLITYPTGFQVTHSRDAIYRLTSILDVGAAANVASFTYQGVGRLKTTTNQNGTTTDYAWDGFRRVLEMDHQNSSAQSFHKIEFLHDDAHDRTMEKNSYNATWLGTQAAAVQTFLGARNAKGDVYVYDMAHRLVDVRYDVTSPASEVASPGSQVYATKVVYALDGLGNRSQVGTTPWGGATTNVAYTNDTVNEYTAIGGVGRSHDNNGNLSDDGSQTYHYDYKNRLVEVRNSSTSATIATYKFDALGRRVEKSVSGGATTRYIFDGQQVVAEYDGSGSWNARYIYEDGIDRPRAMDRADQADVDGDSNTTEVLRFHYHKNALGSVTELTQPTGAVVEWTTYDVYGASTIRNAVGTVVSSSAIGNPYTFTGRRWDGESGLLHYRARAYDPKAGRFLQRDPLGPVSGLGLYEYCSSSPVGRIDPMGTEDFEKCKEGDTPTRLASHALTMTLDKVEIVTKTSETRVFTWGTRTHTKSTLVRDSKTDDERQVRSWSTEVYVSAEVHAGVSLLGTGAKTAVGGRSGKSYRFMNSSSASTSVSWSKATTTSWTMSNYRTERKEYVSHNVYRKFECSRCGGVWKDQSPFRQTPRKERWVTVPGSEKTLVTQSDATEAHRRHADEQGLPPPPSMKFVMTIAEGAAFERADGLVIYGK